MLEILIHHDGDHGAADALASAILDDLRPGERIVVRSRSGTGTLDPAIHVSGDRELVAPSDGDAAPDAVVLLAAGRLTPEPGLLDALRRPPREWDAWTAVMLDPEGAAVVAAGLGITFLGATVPLRAGLPTPRLPETPFGTAALPGAVLVVRRSTLDAMPGVLAGTDPDVVALDLSLRLRVTGARAGVLPAARVRSLPGAPPVDRPAASLGRLRVATRTYPGAVLAAAAPAAIAATSASVARATVNGRARQGLSEAGAAVRALAPALRERRQAAPSRVVDGATFAEGILAEGNGSGHAASRALARAWWGSASSTLRGHRARARRRAARAMVPPDTEH